MHAYRFTILVLLCLYGSGVHSQWIYSQGFAPLTGTPELQRINLNDESFVRLVGMGDMGDIAFHPDQRLLGVIFDKVYLIDTVTSVYTEIHDIGDFQSVGMTIDYKGKMYFSGYNPNTNRFGIAIFDPVLSTTRIVADFGPINQGFINDLEFYNGQLFVVGELPSSFPEPAALFRVDTSGLNLHDTIVEYDFWPGRALAAVNDTCGSSFLVSPTTSFLNYFYPPLDSVRAVPMAPPDGLFYSSGATSRTSHLGSIPVLAINEIDVIQDPCTGSSNATVTILMQQGRPALNMYSLDGTTYQNTNLFTDIVPGQYQVHVRDEWGCQVATPLEITEFSAFYIDVELIPATCDLTNGSIIIHALENGLQYAVDNFQFSNDSIYTDLEGGNHFLVIMDAAGCVDTIDFEIMAYAAPSFEVETEKEQCQARDGVIRLINAKGQGNLQFSLNGADWQDEFDFTALAAGNYTGYIIDTFNCIVSQSIVLEETGKPEITDVDIASEECGKADGGIVLSVVSNHGPIQYAFNGGTFGNSPAFDNLIAGNYIVTVKDTFGCIVETEVEITGTGGPAIDTIVIAHEYCNKSNGSLIISATSMNTPLLFAINDLLLSEANEFHDLSAGVYEVTIIDSYGCEVQTTATIDRIPALQIDSIITVDATCGFENGAIHIITDSSPVTGYSLDRNFLQSDPFFKGLKPGYYAAFLTSYDVCVDSAIVTLNNHAGPVIDQLTVIQPTCEGDPARVVIHGYGNSKILYMLDDTDSNFIGEFVEMDEGIHLISLVDEIGCYLDTTIRIMPVDCSVYLPNVFTPNGDGINDIFSLKSENDNIRIHHVEIFDRWGSKVYSCHINSSGCEWNGKINGQVAPVGVYVYQVVYEIGNDLKHISGHISLLR